MRLFPQFRICLHYTEFQISSGVACGLHCKAKPSGDVAFVCLQRDRKRDINCRNCRKNARVSHRLCDIAVVFIVMFVSSLLSSCSLTKRLLLLPKN